jgi:IS30 family transposase
MEKIKRSASTISRKLRKNKVDKGYRSKTSERAPKIQSALKDLIGRDFGEKQFSPEQLSGRLKGEGGPLRINHTAIYPYCCQRQKVRRELWKSLRHGKKYRREKNEESGPGCSKRRYGDLEIDRIIYPLQLKVFLKKNP